MLRFTIIPTEERLDREADPLARDWPLMTPLQRVHRVALVEFTSAEEWAVTSSIFARRAAILGWREAA